MKEQLLDLAMVHQKLLQLPWLQCGFLMFFLMQKHFIAGLTLGAVK